MDVLINGEKYCAIETMKFAQLKALLYLAEIEIACHPENPHNLQLTPATPLNHIPVINTVEEVPQPPFLLGKSWYRKPVAVR